MTGFESVRPLLKGDKNSRIGSLVIDKAMAVSDAWVDRASFLTKELRVHCPDDQVYAAIATNPAQSGIPITLIDRIADSIIKSHVRKAAAVSFAAGVPGGFALAFTIPADIIQSYRHQIILAQKLHYLYGWPDLKEYGEPDEETRHRITLLVGSMHGISEANSALNLLSSQFAKQVATRVPRQALTKTIYYPALKKTLKWIGISLTKKSFAGGIAKAIPVAGGLTSAGLTSVTLRRAAKNLKNHLRELRFAQPPQGKYSVDVEF